jgi:hypothetical protein
LKTGNSIQISDGPYKCLIHLDRLSITFKHWSGSTFHDVRNPDFISCEQKFNTITLIHDSAPGIGAFYHTFKVLYKGYVVGKLHTATKLKKHELQFDFSKQVFYSFSPDFWHEVTLAIKDELGLKYNNIHYLEVSIDANKNLVEAFGSYYGNCINNHLRSGDRYRMRKGTIVNVMCNGSSFVIGGSENSIEIYNKSAHAEQFILDYFENNGLAGQEVHRIEARLSWNYIRYLRNRRHLNIDVETLLDAKKLATIFQESTRNKIVFEDTMFKTNDIHGNSHYKRISVVDDLPISTAEIGQLNPNLQINHYKNDSVDKNIIRQNYFRYLECGNPEYLENFKSSGKVACYSKEQLSALISKFNKNFMGNRTSEIIERMEYAKKYISPKPAFKLGEVFYAMRLKLKWHLLGFF